MSSTSFSNPLWRARSAVRHTLAALAVAALVAFGLTSGTTAQTPEPTIADIELQDGSFHRGTIDRLSDRTVRITTEDGRSMLVAVERIKGVDGRPYGSGMPAGGGGDAGGGDGSDSGTVTGAVGDRWNTLRQRAELVREPVVAVDLWERFLTRDDLTQAERDSSVLELQKWKQRYQEGAERIRGSWVGGDDLKKMKDEANELVEEALRIEKVNPTEAMRKYGRALAAYPNAFRPHYRLAYVKFHQGRGSEGGNLKLAEAEAHARQALRLQPQLPAVLSSMGACLFVRDKYEEGLEYMLRAVEIAPTETTAGNLLAAVDATPDSFKRANRRIREISLAAELLRGEYSANQLVWIEDFTHGSDQRNPDAPDAGPPGLRGNGSGFFVTADGYVITNKHVAETDKGYYYRVRLSTRDEDGNFVEYPARFVAASDAYDVALLKVELPDGKTASFFYLLEENVPPVQADVMTAGYPSAGTQSFVFQTARGTVSSNDTDDKDFDLYLDMKTTQGNSGGPIFDRNGHVVGITTAYRRIYDSIVSLAVGPRQIREFLGTVSDAPTLTYDTSTDRPFDAVKLAEEARARTVLVLIFAGEAGEFAGAGGKNDPSEGGEGDPDDDVPPADDDDGEGDDGEGDDGEGDDGEGDRE